MFLIWSKLSCMLYQILWPITAWDLWLPFWILNVLIQMSWHLSICPFKCISCSIVFSCECPTFPELVAVSTPIDFPLIQFSISVTRFLWKMCHVISNTCSHSAQQFQIAFFSYRLLPEFDLMIHSVFNLCLFLMAVPSTNEVICPPLLLLLPGPF